LAGLISLRFSALSAQVPIIVKTDSCLADAMQAKASATFRLVKFTSFAKLHHVSNVNDLALVKVSCESVAKRLAIRS
jgi:hypothetical protein